MRKDNRNKKDNRSSKAKGGKPHRGCFASGTLQVNMKGFGFVILDVDDATAAAIKAGTAEKEEDIFIPVGKLGQAMNGDHVKVKYTVNKISKSKPGLHAKEGEVVEILEHANNRIVGTFTASRSFGFVDPDDVRIKEGIYIPKGQSNGAVTGQKVVVEITKWPGTWNSDDADKAGRIDGLNETDGTGQKDSTRKKDAARRGKTSGRSARLNNDADTRRGETLRKAEGRVVDILGMTGDPGVDILSIMSQYDLSEGFPDEVQAAANAIPQRVDKRDWRGRVDRRHLSIVTVDGEDAKDLDDGVYAEKNKDGTYFLGVYIADVSYYVREHQPLDREARERGTSVYLVDRVIPMLPKELSNGICSLNAGVDRLAMACEMRIGRDGQVKGYDIFPTVIHVHRRLTYTMVNRMLVEKDQELRRDNADIIGMLETLEELHGAMQHYRHARGSIGFNVPEIKVKLDEKGRPVKLIKREGSLGESIIEQCMLAANETVAEHMCRQKLPFMYRVHEEPNSEKLGNLNLLLMTFGLGLHSTAEGTVTPKDIQQVLERVEGRPEEKLISSVALRSMQQARYSADSLGHFGLAAKYYTHFTSPIRRYPDLIVHRLLRESFAEGGISKSRQEKLRMVLPEIADHASARERLATEAERSTTDLKKVEYMQQYIGETFTGIISGVTNFGIFVELENGVEGLVRAASLMDDYYDYVESRYELYGQRRHRSYRLGDQVEVVLTRADMESKTIDFVVRDNCARGSLVGLRPVSWKDADTDGRDGAFAGANSLIADIGEEPHLTSNTANAGKSSSKRRLKGSSRYRKLSEHKETTGKDLDKKAPTRKHTSHKSGRPARTAKAKHKPSSAQRKFEQSSSKGGIINGGYGPNRFGSVKAATRSAGKGGAVRSSTKRSSINGKKKRSHKNSLREPQG